MTTHGTKNRQERKCGKEKKVMCGLAVTNQVVRINLEMKSMERFKTSQPLVTIRLTYCFLFSTQIFTNKRGFSTLIPRTYLLR